MPATAAAAAAEEAAPAEAAAAAAVRRMRRAGEAASHRPDPRNQEGTFFSKAAPLTPAPGCWATRASGGAAPAGTPGGGCLAAAQDWAAARVRLETVGEVETCVKPSGVGWCKLQRVIES